MVTPRQVVTLLSVPVAAALVSAPYWLPQRVTALRGRIFAAVNGDHTLTLPGGAYGPEVFERVYAHPAANGRSAGAGLSDLFWYWLSPGPEVHQEHLEAGPRYDDVAAATKRVLAGPSADLSATARRLVARTLDALPAGHTSLVRLRDLVMPAWAELSYEMVFGKPCPPEARDLIVGHARDVITALKCTGLRHPARRAALSAYLREHLAEVRHPLPASLTPEEQVHYVQGTFFNTAVVQLSEATAHVLLAVAQHPGVQETLRAGGDDRYLDHVLDETFQHYPLFGIAHRITTDDIALTPHETLPKGSVVCFDYAAYHAGDARFDPGRWDHKQERHIPFGMPANRPCPAIRVSPLVIKAAVREFLRRYRLVSTAAHTRSLPNRGPCLLVPLDDDRPHRWVQRYVRVRDRVEDVVRSVVQLVLGTVMVLHARRLRLAARYFEGNAHV